MTKERCGVPADWSSIFLTVVLVLGLLVGSKYFKAYYGHVLPKWRPIPVLIAWNALLTLVVLLDHYAQGFTVPGYLAPVAFVGGNATLATFFGVPEFGRRKTAAKPATDPERERIVPTAKKKRHKRRK